jgi:hypothetical protein
MNTFEFEGNTYNDDRLFVLHVCPCTIQENNQNLRTTIYHGQPPANHYWCVVTFRNTDRFPAVSVKHFHTEDEANGYKDHVEPTTPRISTGGQGANPAPSLEQFREWKLLNDIKDYDYRQMFLEDSVNPTETITTPK